NRRITVYSVGAIAIPYTGVRNAASLDILARANVTIAGTIQAGDVITLNIGGTPTTDSAGKTTTTGGSDYKHTVGKDETIGTIITSLAADINAANSNTGDTKVYATPDPAISALLLTSRLPGVSGNDITVNVAVTAATSSTVAG